VYPVSWKVPAHQGIRAVVLVTGAKETGAMCGSLVLCTLLC